MGEGTTHGRQGGRRHVPIESIMSRILELLMSSVGDAPSPKGQTVVWEGHAVSTPFKDGNVFTSDI
jgi:hypothetical protein